MNPKEKAFERVNKFSELLPAEGTTTGQTPMDCAIIAVNEIVETGTLSDRQCGYLKIEKQHKEYWELVRYEIKIM